MCETENEFYEGFFSRVKMLFSEEELTKIRSSKVLIAGLGGVGSSAAYFLARYGVRDFFLVDPDLVEISNLNRQFFFYIDVDTPKVFAVKRLIMAINPYAHVEAYYSKIEDLGEKLENIVEHVDIIIDGMDKYISKIRLSRLAKSKGKPLVHASGLGGAARITVFEPGTPYYEETFNLPSKGKDPGLVNEEEFREYKKRAFKTYVSEFITDKLLDRMVSEEIPFQVLVPATVLSGLIAATEAVKVILGKPHITAPKVLHIDLWTLKFEIVEAKPF